MDKRNLTITNIPIRGGCGEVGRGMGDGEEKKAYLELSRILLIKAYLEK